MSAPDVPDRLRIAVIGSRGVPASWGGIERHVEEVGARLADRGHEVTVYSRTNYQPGSTGYRGMHVRALRTVGTKHLDAIVHSASSTLRVLGRRADIIHFHAIGPGALAPVARAGSSAGVVLTVHGLDNERAKWGFVARSVLGAAARISARAPHRVIAVSEALTEHYRERGASVVHVPNGVTRPPSPIARGKVCEELGLGDAPYVLFVGRLVPEKAPDLLVEAFRSVPGNVRLVLVGESRFMDEYSSRIRTLAAADTRVRLAGYRYLDELAELYANAAAFVLPSSLEGLPLTLLEAGAHGLPVVATSIPPHVEILGEDGPGCVLVEVGDVAGLARGLGTVLADPGAKAAAQDRRDALLARYDWDDVAARTEAVYRAVLRERRGSA